MIKDWCIFGLFCMWLLIGIYYFVGGGKNEVS